jgi:hypothetical protein
VIISGWEIGLADGRQRDVGCCLQDTRVAPWEVRDVDQARDDAFWSELVGKYGGVACEAGRVCRHLILLSGLETTIARGWGTLDILITPICF